MRNEFQQAMNRSPQRPLWAVTGSLVVSAIGAVGIGYPLQEYLLDVLPNMNGHNPAYFAIPTVFVGIFATMILWMQKKERDRTQQFMQAALDSESDGFDSFEDLLDESERRALLPAAQETELVPVASEKPLLVPTAAGGSASSVAVPASVRQT